MNKEAERLKVDITNYSEVEEIIKEVEPTVVINVTAIADIDEAELEKELAWGINVIGARNVALACEKYQIKYVFLSSDAVFDGNEMCYIIVSRLLEF